MFCISTWHSLQPLTPVVTGTAEPPSDSASQQGGQSPVRRFDAAARQLARQLAWQVAVSDPPVAVAVHRDTHEVFVGTRHGAIALLDRKLSDC